MDATKEYDIEHHDELVERFIAKHSSEYWQFVASEMYGEQTGMEPKIRHAKS